jgi:hypothetical protein
MRRPSSAEEILEWIDRFAFRVEFQNLSARAREKNRVIMQYRAPSGAIAAVGGRDLRSAVIRAWIRLELTS